MLTLRHLLPAFATVLFLYACTKDDLPQAGGERLQKIIFRSDSMLQVNFFYDEQGRLAAIEDSNSQSHIYRTQIYYNDQNRMVKATQRHYFGSRSNLLDQLTDTFLYDINNRIIERQAVSTIQNTGTSYTTSGTYSYDGQGRLVADLYYNSYYNGVAAYTTYTYDGNDNIVQSESFSRAMGTLQSNGITTASYTAQKNPLQSLGMAAYLFLWDGGWLLSKHTRNHLRYPNGATIDYKYDNYSNGLPRTITDTYKYQNHTSIRTTEFFYQ
jgi:hypothetical protein